MNNIKDQQNNYCEEDRIEYWIACIKKKVQILFGIHSKLASIIADQFSQQNINII